MGRETLSWSPAVCAHCISTTLTGPANAPRWGGPNLAEPWGQEGSEGLGFPWEHAVHQPCLVSPYLASASGCVRTSAVHSKRYVWKPQGAWLHWGTSRLAPEVLDLQREPLVLGASRVLGLRAGPALQVSWAACPKEQARRAGALKEAEAFELWEGPAPGSLPSRPL